MNEPTLAFLFGVTLGAVFTMCFLDYLKEVKYVIIEKSQIVSEVK